MKMKGYADDPASYTGRLSTSCPILKQLCIYIETACVVRLAYPPLVVAATRIYTAAHHSVITHIRRHHIFNVQHHPSAYALSRKLVKIQHLPRRAHVAIFVLESACGVPLRCATLHTTHAQGKCRKPRWNTSIHRENTIALFSGLDIPVGTKSELGYLFQKVLQKIASCRF